MKNLVTTIALIMTAVLVAACGVRGNGNVIEESHDVSGFSEIKLSGIGTVIITQGESESLTVSAESNIMPLLEVKVSGNTLELGQKPNRSLNPTRDIIFTVTVKDLNRIEVSGSGSMEISSVDTESFSIKVSGSGDVTIESLTADSLSIDLSGSGKVTIDNGVVNEQELKISGSGSYEARHVESETAHIKISGSGSATVSVSDELTGNISGSGSINYFGDASTSISTSGSGSVNRIAD